MFRNWYTFRTLLSFKEIIKIQKLMSREKNWILLCDILLIYIIIETIFKNHRIE